MTIRLPTLLFTAMVVALANSPSAARDWGDWLSGGMILLKDTTSNETGWRGNAAMGVGLAPRFRGSVNYDPTFLPLIDLEWNDRIFFSTQRGIGFNAVRQSRTKAGPRVTLDWGRKPTDHADLADTPTVKRTTEVGLFLVHCQGSWRIDGDIRIGIAGGHDAISAEISISYGRRINAETSLILGSGLELNNSEFNKAYYDDRRSAFSELWVRADVVYEFRTPIYIAFSVKGGGLSGPTKTASYTGDSSFFSGALIGYRF